MSTTDNKPQSDIEALLPWHAAGTLDRTESKRVEQALADDPELARRYALVRDELGETIVLNESLGAPSAQAMDKLFAKIDAEPARKQATSFGLAARLTAYFAELSPRTLVYASAAAVLALVLQAGIIATVVVKEQGGGYVTASAPTAVTGPGAFALVRFAAQASQDDVTSFLTANTLSIVAGPSAGGLYKLRIADAPLPPADLAGRIKALRDNKVIGFIAPTE